MDSKRRSLEIEAEMTSKRIADISAEKDKQTQDLEEAIRSLTKYLKEKDDNERRERYTRN